MAVSHKFDPNNPSAAHLDHDHRESENISFFTVFPFLFQNLWCSPSCSMALIARGASYGIQVFSYPGEAEIRDPCVAGGVHKDVRLEMYQSAVI